MEIMGLKETTTAMMKLFDDLCKNVQKANFGSYPLYWVEAVVNSGLVGELYKSWAEKKAEEK